MGASPKLFYLNYNAGRNYNERHQLKMNNNNSPQLIKDNNPVYSMHVEGIVIWVFTAKDQDYILYHRIFPQKKDYVLRQLCLDSLAFDRAGNINKVSTTGVASTFKRK